MQRSKPTSKKPGLPPGSMVYTRGRVQDNISLQLIQFNESAVHRAEHTSIEALLGALDTARVNWININGLHDTALIEHLGTYFEISPLVLEDILHADHMPKLENHETYLFMTLKMLTCSSPGNAIEQEHVSMILGDYYLITFQEKDGDVFDAVRESLHTGKSRLRKRLADYLFYRLLDTIVDHYYLITDQIDDALEGIEEALLHDETDSVSEKILRERKKMIFLRRNILPLREAMHTLKQRDVPQINESTYGFLDDVFDHLIHLVQALENFRDLINSLMELHMAVNAKRMNNVMKTLTIFAAIFMPLTFMAGIYGMNFHVMPELQWRWGYPLVLAVMAFVAGLLLIYMKRRRWL